MVGSLAPIHGCIECHTLARVNACVFAKGKATHLLYRLHYTILNSHWQLLCCMCLSYISQSPSLTSGPWSYYTIITPAQMVLVLSYQAQHIALYNFLFYVNGIGTISLWLHLHQCIVAMPGKHNTIHHEKIITRLRNSLDLCLFHGGILSLLVEVRSLSL